MANNQITLRLLLIYGIVLSIRTHNYVHNTEYFIKNNNRTQRYIITFKNKI